MILYLHPFFSSRPWHGQTLSKIYDCPKDTGEAWICSGYKGKSSTILNGEYQGMTLEQLFDLHKADLFGMPNEVEFPVLLKIIDADDDLSVQVHPDNEYAKIHHNGFGKFECWYFLPENKATEVVVGINCKTKKELSEAIDNHLVMDVIKKSPLKCGDYMRINPGCVHALKGGSYVLETQQPSDITYRLYDYDRKPLRELHIEDSLNVIDFEAKSDVEHLGDLATDENKYFVFDKIKIDDGCLISSKKVEIIFVIDGNGTINGDKLKKNDCILLIDEYELNIKGKMTIAKIFPKGA